MSVLLSEVLRECGTVIAEARSAAMTAEAEVIRLRRQLQAQRASHPTREAPRVNLADRGRPIVVAGRFELADISWDVSRGDDRVVRLTVASGIVIKRSELDEIIRAFDSF